MNQSIVSCSGSPFLPSVVAFLCLRVEAIGIFVLSYCDIRSCVGLWPFAKGVLLEGGE